MYQDAWRELLAALQLFVVPLVESGQRFPKEVDVH